MSVVVQLLAKGVLGYSFLCFEMDASDSDLGNWEFLNESGVFIMKELLQSYQVASQIFSDVIKKFIRFYLN